VSPETALHRDGPRGLLCNFRVETCPLGGCPGKFFDRFVKGVLVLELRATGDCLWGWSGPIDMSGRDESLDELVRLECRKSLGNMFKIGLIFILPNLCILYFSFSLIWCQV